MEVVNDVNDTTDAIYGKKLFFVVGDHASEGFKMHLYWLKVRCLYCGEYFQLCPPKKNLLTNLQNHLQSLQHTKLVSYANSASTSKSSALSSRHASRPTRFSVYKCMEWNKDLTFHFVCERK
jgi:hypothetical protein